MRNLFRAILIGFALLLVWQSIIWASQVPAYILPSPLEVWQVFYHQSPLIFAQAIPTLTETVIGFFLGVVCGSLAGALIAYYKPLTRWFLPILIISQAIPTFAVAPLLVIWLGYGLLSKIVTTILMIFFPVASALYDGLRQTHADLEMLAKSMGAPKWRLFAYIRLPAALPSLASGIRIAAVIAPIGAIVGEWVGSSQGLGYLMLNANAMLQIDMMFAALIVIILLALLLYFSVDIILRHFIWWQKL